MLTLEERALNSQICDEAFGIHAEQIDGFLIDPDDETLLHSSEELKKYYQLLRNRSQEK